MWHTDFDGSIYTASYESFAANPQGSQFGGYDVALGNFDGRHSATGKPILDIAVIGDFGLSVSMTGSRNGPIIKNIGTIGTRLAVGDFTGNGNTDLLVTGFGVPGVLLGNGDGTFQNPQGISTDLSAVMAVVGDFDGRHYSNGLPILDVATIGPTGINVYMNKGNSTLGFNAPVSYPLAGLNPSSITVGDFRGNGKLDLAVANADSNNVSVFLANGDGTFQSAVNYAVGSDPRSVGVGDFNGDGKPDLAVANNGGRGTFGTSSVSVLLGTGKGTFLKAQNFAEVTDNKFATKKHVSGIAPTGGTDYWRLAVGDFAGLGYSGVAVASFHGAEISAMQGFGTSLFQPASQLGLGGNDQSAVAVGDFTDDGKSDVALTSNNFHPIVLPGKGDGTFSSPIDSPDHRTTTGLDVCDFNGDGKLDLVRLGGSIHLQALLGNGDGTFQASFQLTSDGLFRSVAVGDFNGDGKSDLAVSQGSKTSPDLLIYLANGDGTFGKLNNGSYDPNHIYPNAGGGNASGTAVGDFNGDGKLDLEETGVGLLLGNGDGTFQSPVSDGVAGRHVAAADLDGRRYANGRPILDLVTIASDGRSVHGRTSELDGVNVYLGNADGTFQKPVFYRTPNVIGLGDPDPAVFREPLAVADFNGDGKLDIAVFNGP
ncbi:MAG TPA: VCBS repeat-containing protein, partial [Gemmataceae bacterium]|nr:VCBS repeat-containing protein [Gemmataceae bacterium]